MSETTSLPIAAPPRRLRLDWIPGVLFTPRQILPQIAAQSGSAWFLPLMVLTITSILLVVVSAPVRQQAALANPPELPPNFEYYTPEQQAQFQQAMAATQSPVFLYVFPALSAVARVWLGWLIVGGMIHLALTLLGGRGATASAMNLVAWAALPLAVRDLVRIFYIQSSHQLIAAPGIAGFAPGGESGWSAFLAALLALVDLYLLWHALLLVIGIRSADQLALGKTWGAVGMVLLLVLSLQALAGYLVSRLGSLTIIRPFF